MSAVRSFLDWFDGVAAFMGDKAPKPDEWQKIKARIEQLRTDVDNEPAAQPYQGLSVVAAAPAAPKEPDWKASPLAWESYFLATCIEGGIDNETAREMLFDKDIDRKADPRPQANRKIVGLGGTPVAA
jgi:hypothetical protein